MKAKSKKTLAEWIACLRENGEWKKAEQMERDEVQGKEKQPK